MAKLHLKNGCSLARNYWLNRNFTTDTDKVTCSHCRKKIARLGLRPRQEFARIPTFVMTPNEDGITGSFQCPVCGQVNNHGYSDGHRVAHCPCWESGYYVTTQNDWNEH